MFVFHFFSLKHFNAVKNSSQPSQYYQMCASLFTSFENKNTSYDVLKISSAELCKPINLQIIS